ncbi:MAG: hypothetical protein H7Y27_09240 [Gemmatimonadaceae bacterium]|nr:hypothetical protein [Chitinophagaceae bacterium]
MSTYRVIRKKLTKNIRVISRKLTMIAPEGILPYAERPSDSRSEKTTDNADQKRIGAHDLFTMFTADIIHEQIVYGR